MFILNVSDHSYYWVFTFLAAYVGMNTSMLCAQRLTNVYSSSSCWNGQLLPAVIFSYNTTCAACLALLVGGFRWMSEKERKNGKLEKEHTKYSWRRLRKSQELHDQHNHYPLAPESLTTNKTSKLVPNLNNKTKYFVHYSNHKLYELCTTKVHWGLTFNDSNWMIQHFELNTNLRIKATNDCKILSN